MHENGWWNGAILPQGFQGVAPTEWDAQVGCAMENIFVDMIHLLFNRNLDCSAAGFLQRLLSSGCLFKRTEDLKLLYRMISSCTRLLSCIRVTSICRIVVSKS